MITVPEAARRVRRNPETIRRWIREGKLAAQRIGTQYLVDEDRLDEVAGSGHAVPSRLDETATGEPMPDFLAALDRCRSAR